MNRLLSELAAGTGFVLATGFVIDLLMVPA